MNKECRLLALALAFALVLLSIPFSSPYVSAATSVVPTLYCNDEAWYKDADLPLVRYYSSYLVPISLFEMLDGFEVEDSREGEFMITNRNTGAYMSFNYLDSYVMTDRQEEFYFVSHRMYSSEYYVSAETVCEYLGLSCEIYSSSYDDSLCVRIKDNSAQMTIEQLLLRYNPAALGIESVRPDTVIEPYAKGRKVYFTFEGVDEVHTEQILSTLRRNGMSATFFLTEEDITDRPESVIRIYAEGHSIGILAKTKVEGGELDFDDLMAQLGRFNQRLFQLLKIRTRLVRTDLSSADTTRILSGVHYENLKYCGYVLWHYNNGTYGLYLSEENIYNDMIETVTNRRFPVVHIPNTDAAVAAFVSAAPVLAARGNYAFLPISPAVEEYNYIENIQK